MKASQIGPIKTSAVKDLLAFANAANTETLRKVLQDREATSDRLFAVIPREIAQLALLVRTPLLYEALLASAPDTVRSELSQAKHFVDEHLAGIENHPAMLRLMREQIKAGVEADSDSGGLLTEITGFETAPLWFQGESGLAPVIMVCLKGVGKKVLLRATLDWDDLSFVASGFIKLFRDELKRAEKMSKSGQLELPYKDAVSKRLAEIVDASEQLRELASALEFPSVANLPTTDKAK